MSWSVLLVNLISYQHLILGKSLTCCNPVLRIKRRKMARTPLTEKRNITPEMAVKILQKRGVQIDEKKAAEVLDLLYILANLTVNQILSEYETEKNNEKS
jgi:hypothetical protein